MEFKVASYNCRGLPKDKSRLYLRPDIIELFNSHDIIALQETHLSIQELKILNSLHDSFVGVGAAKIDETCSLINGRYSGGVAIFWKIELSKYIKQLTLDSNWCVGIEIILDSIVFSILNVYMPYQKPEHEDLYFENLGYLKSCIDELNTSNICILGDFNANLGVSGNKLFSNCLIDFCNENSLIISDKINLPDDTYTYVSTREGRSLYSWLDHVVSSTDFHSCINDIQVLYNVSDDDHIPITMKLKVSNLPKVEFDSNNYNNCFNITWDTVTENDLKKYCELTDKNISNISIPTETIICTNINCKNLEHLTMTKNFYNDIVKCLVLSSKHISNNVANSFNKPGWTEYVSDLYNYSREIRQVWIENGKPRQGAIFSELSRSRARFKYALRFIRKNESELRKESLAKKMTNPIYWMPSITLIWRRK